MENLKNHCIYCSTDNFLNIENIGVRKTPFSLKYKKNSFFQNFTLFYISSDTEICWRSDRIRNTALSLPRGVSPYFLFAVCVCLLQEAIMRVAKLPHGEDKDPPLPREWPLASLITGKLKRTREGGVPPGQKLPHIGFIYSRYGALTQTKTSQGKLHGNPFAQKDMTARCNDQGLAICCTGKVQRRTCVRLCDQEVASCSVDQVQHRSCVCLLLWRSGESYI